MAAMKQSEPYSDGSAFETGRDRRAPASERQGVVILDAGGQICVLTSVAEELLGWRSADAAGRPCAAVLRCQDGRGESLCSQCGFVGAIARRELVPPTLMWMADPMGRRQPMSTAFWYLPPAGRYREARIMAVVRSGDMNSGAVERPGPTERRAAMTEQMAPFIVGQEVVAGEEAIGELIGTLHHDDVDYLHVRRYGPGLDDLYIPSIAVRRVVPGHIYLDLNAEALLGQSWHVRPDGATV
jgi:hypothetical protein